MLILEIAAGIVLAVLVLAFWPFILAGGAVLAVCALLFYAAGNVDESARLAREREHQVQVAASREATPRELVCEVGGILTEAKIMEIVRTGPVKAALLSPACVLDGPVVPPAKPPSLVMELMGPFFLLTPVIVVLSLVATGRLESTARYLGRYVGRLIDWIFGRVGSAKANRETR